MTAEDTVRSSFGRPLKSSEPDLEIVVGKEKEVLHYHSVIMASYSEYIDTMLSTPMKEQDTKTLSFPDIQPREWKKMIAFLEPGGNRNMNLQDFCELLPLFDEYCFQTAVELCDNIFADLFTNNPETATLENESMVMIAVLSFEYGLPLSKDRAVDFAKHVFETKCSFLDEESYRSLIPLVKDEESALKEIVTLFVGEDEVKEKSFKDMQEFVLKETFPALFQTTTQAMRDQAISRKLEVKGLVVLHAGMESTNGSYERVQKLHPGVMAVAYENPPHALDNKSIIRALDPFGNKWQISHVDGDGVEQILYTWRGLYSSLVPPKRGWVVPVEAQDYAPAPTLGYRVKTGY